MNPSIRFADRFKVAGTVSLETCPVCGGAAFEEIWRLPQTRLVKGTKVSAPGAPYDGYSLNYLPTLRVPQDIFIFDICENCESIFLNPKKNDHEEYASDTSKIESFRQHGLEGFRGLAETVRKWFPTDTKKVVDSACGPGQVLALLRKSDPDLDLMGLELSQPAVEFINHELGIPACAVDLDYDDLDLLIPPGTVDFVVLVEAFEHVRRPVSVMQKMVRLLRPGGRLYFTAQYYGDNSLQIRVGEPIYINQKGFEYVIGQLGVNLLQVKNDVKIRAVIEKPL